MWDGLAKQAFLAAVRDDLSRLQELVKAMQALTGKNGEARGEYDKCENAMGLLTKNPNIQAHCAEGNKKDALWRQVVARIILLRFKATAERRQ